MVSLIFFLSYIILPLNFRLFIFVFLFSIKLKFFIVIVNFLIFFFFLLFHSVPSLAAVAIPVHVLLLIAPSFLGYFLWGGIAWLRHRYSSSIYNYGWKAETGQFLSLTVLFRGTVSKLKKYNFFRNNHMVISYGYILFPFYFIRIWNVHLPLISNR